jgi:hypothetical protein
LLYTCRGAPKRPPSRRAINPCKPYGSRPRARLATPNFLPKTAQFRCEKSVKLKTPFS